MWYSSTGPCTVPPAATPSSRRRPSVTAPTWRLRTSTAAAWTARGLRFEDGGTGARWPPNGVHGARAWPCVGTRGTRLARAMIRQAAGRQHASCGEQQAFRSGHNTRSTTQGSEWTLTRACIRRHHRTDAGLLFFANACVRAGPRLRHPLAARAVPCHCRCEHRRGRVRQPHVADGERHARPARWRPPARPWRRGERVAAGRGKRQQPEDAAEPVAAAESAQHPAVPESEHLDCLQPRPIPEMPPCHSSITRLRRSPRSTGRTLWYLWDTRQTALPLGSGCRR